MEKKERKVIYLKRNHGISLLRLILMFMIVVLHILGHGGVLMATTPMTAKNAAAWLLEALGNCAANGYALISGYVYVNNRHKFSSLVQIWLQALLYSIGIAACLWILKPAYFSPEALRAYLTPVSSDAYWYLTAYVGLFLLIPFLNAGIHSLSEAQAKPLMALLFLFYSVLPTLTGKDLFYANNGYSAFWLVYMYLVGGCIHKFGWGDSLKPAKALLVYLLSALVCWVAHVSPIYSAYAATGEVSASMAYISYTRPTMVIAAIALFLLFKNASIPSRWVRMISQLSPAAFGVYLIHEHNYIRGHFIHDRFGFLAGFSTPVMVGCVFAIALAVFTACLLADWVRCKVFRWLQVRERLEALENRILHCDTANI